MIAICKREFKRYFHTAAGWVFIGMFLLLSGVCFSIVNLAVRSCDLLSTLQYMGYIWMLLSPLLVMRLLAGERAQRTDLLLFSSPCTPAKIVLGKFLAACSLMLIAAAVSWVYCLITAIWGTLCVPETLAGYLGFLLLGTAWLSLDILISSLFDSAFSAGVACIGINLLLWLADIVSEAFASASVRSVIAFISLYRRFENFSAGRISFSDTVFYILFTVVMLFICVRILDSRRWSEHGR